jgi:hypothetical protein
MFTAPDLIIACPYCQALARLFQLATADLTGAITWTDGWQDAPLLPRPPRITRCPACAKAYWTAEAAPVGYHDPELETSPAKAAWVAAPNVEPLDERGLMDALAEGLAYSPELELELRVAIWWRGNDAFRKEDAPVGFATAPDAVANMRRVIELCADGEEDLLLFRAEAQRHLGEFVAAKETLGGVGCSDYWPAKSRLLELIEREDRKLRIMFAS